MPAASPGSLRAIWLKRFKRGPMDPRDAAILVPGVGLLGNANKGGRRQVVLLDEEAWAGAMADLGAALDPAARRANLLLSGIRLEKSRGRILRIGPVRLRIWSECSPCYQMDQAFPGLQRALRPHWRAGACAEVLDGGEIRVGDEAAWEEETAGNLSSKSLKHFLRNCASTMCGPEAEEDHQWRSRSRPREPPSPATFWGAISATPGRRRSGA